MPTTVAQALASVQTYCGNPPDSVLPQYAILSFLLDVNGSLNNDLNLSDQSWFLSRLNLNSPQKDISLPLEDFASLVAVNRQLDATNDVWETVPIVEFSEINDREDEGVYAVCRYGTPPRMRFSWNPADNADVIRVWHEPTPTEASAHTSNIQMRPGFIPLLTMRAAMLCRDRIGLPISPAMAYELQRYERQWDTWRRKSANEGWQQRSSWGSGRNNNIVAGRTW